MKKYGIPYKGSKSRIIDRLFGVIPHDGFDNFYDLFAGGCVGPHQMLLFGHF